MSDFTTADLGLAAYLFTIGFHLRRLDGPSRRTFVFPSTACGAIEGYYIGGLVQAWAFADALHDLLARLREGGQHDHE